MDDLTPAERAAVEALAWYATGGETARPELDEVDQAEALRCARMVLAAASPYVAAEALREAAEEIRAEAADTKGNGRYAIQSRTQKIYARLRERADEIERGATAGGTDD